MYASPPVLQFAPAIDWQFIKRPWFETTKLAEICGQNWNQGNDVQNLNSV